MFHVVLINPHTRGNYRKELVSTANLGLASLASYLQKGNHCKVTIIDARAAELSAEKLAETLAQVQPQLVGISLCVDESAEWTKDVLTILRRSCPATHIVMGSYFPSLYPAKAFERIPQAHSIVIGEGEATLSALVSALSEGEDWRILEGIAYRDMNGDVHINPRRRLIDCLDDLPFPQRYLATGNGELFEAMLEGTRGCKFFCSFCAVRPFYGLSTGPALRMRSARHIVGEISELCRQYPKLQSFRFVDPDFIAPHTACRAAEFAELLMKTGLSVHLMMDTRTSSVVRNVELLKLLKQAGLNRLYLGIESGSPHILKKMNKAVDVQDNYQASLVLDQLDIDYSYGFMMVTPWSTDEDIELNAKLLASIGRIEFRSLFHELTLVPGTPAYQTLEKENKLLWTGHLSYYTYTTSSCRIENFRKIGRLLQSTHPSFFGRLAGYIYESIRILRRHKDSTSYGVEKLADRLFLDIFDSCWSEARNTNPDSDHLGFVNGCYDQFRDRFLDVLSLLDPDANISDIAQGSLPKRALAIQT